MPVIRKFIFPLNDFESNLIISNNNLDRSINVFMENGSEVQIDFEKKYSIISKNEKM